MTFKPGNKVVCMDSTWSDQALQEGTIYTISRTFGFGGSLQLIETSDEHWMAGRFRLATEEEVRTVEGKGESTTKEELGLKTLGQLRTIIPKCLIPEMDLTLSQLKPVVTMALLWQSEQPHVEGCNHLERWTLGSTQDGMRPLYSYNIDIGEIRATWADEILGTLNAAEKEAESPDCPTCEALEELEEEP